MKKDKINGAISLTCPDSYSEMGEEELARYFGSAANRWGAHDYDRHIVLSVGWSKVGLLNKLTDADSFLFGLESRMRRGLLNYQQVCRYKIKIGGKKAVGVRFEYRVNDSCMVHIADLIAFKYKNQFYTIHFVSRKINAAASRPELKEILGSAELS